MKVLIADDDTDLRELIGFTLAQAGYLVARGRRRERAGIAPSSTTELPDLVVLDINMPGDERLPGVRGDPPSARACR